MLIGKPIANTQVYILSQNQLAAIGVTGEICIGGRGVGRGYWQRPELTAEKFIEHPALPGQRIYLTGDLGRWTDEGKIECLGRMDQQVKVGGYRVETGEIEHLLLAHPQIGEAAVVARNLGSEKELVAYVTGSGAWQQGEQSLAGDLRAYLQEQLPVYMIPAHFVLLDRLPLNENGKLERKALPDPQRNGSERADGYLAPRSKVEEQLVEIWQQVLGVERIGIEDNFFELGGHSLKANQVVSRIHKLLDVRVPLRTFFESATVAQLARVIAQSNSDKFAAIQPVAVQEFYELSHAQKRLWLMHQLEGAVAYNMPEAYTLEDEQLDGEALQRAFVTLIERHEALRTAFVLVDGEPKQKVFASLPFALRQIDLRQSADGEAQAAQLADQEANTPFDLSQPPLLRATLIRISERKSLFLLTIHHIIGDGWSGQVLYHEMLAIYAAYRRGAANPLAPLRIQYKDVTAWQNARDLAPAERYWLAQLAGVADALRLPYDFASQGERQFQGSNERVVVSGAPLEGLRQVARQHKTTMANVILALFKLLLFQVSKQSDICIGVANANRNHPDLENMLGFFVNILPIRSQINSEMEFGDLLQQVIKAMNEALEHQEYPFDLLVQKLNPRRHANRQPILNVVYGYQGFSNLRIDLGFQKGKEQESSSQLAFGELKNYDFSFETAKFDLTLFVLEEKDALYLTLEYDSELFRSETIKRYLTGMQRFAQMVAKSAQPKTVP